MNNGYKTHHVFISLRAHYFRNLNEENILRDNLLCYFDNLIPEAQIYIIFTSLFEILKF